MTHEQVYYCLLSALAMLLVTNGVLRFRDNWYNLGLGLLLFGVLAVETDGAYSALHQAFAAAFFIGIGLVVLFASKEVSWPIRTVLVSVILASLLLWKPFGVITTFWAEWISMGALAAHFWLDSTSDARLPESVRAYRSMRWGEKPDLVEWVEGRMPRHGTKPEGQAS
jgi:lysylphosphatidylglycerol synthetase-like protein (DUF2156 family)